jgi:hypothetical protein
VDALHALPPAFAALAEQDRTLDRCMILAGFALTFVREPMLRARALAAVFGALQWVPVYPGGRMEPDVSAD